MSLFGFTPYFLTAYAAAVFSKLNISCDIRPIKMIFYCVNTSYLMDNLLYWSWSDLDLTFDLAVVTLTYKILSGLYLGNRKV